jgi:hypothetical protein
LKRRMGNATSRNINCFAHPIPALTYRVRLLKPNELIKCLGDNVAAPTSGVSVISTSNPFRIVSRGHAMSTRRQATPFDNIRGEPIDIGIRAATGADSLRVGSRREDVGKLIERIRLYAGDARKWLFKR